MHQKIELDKVGQSNNRFWRALLRRRWLSDNGGTECSPYPLP
jgi:hypothetical protein